MAKIRWFWGLFFLGLGILFELALVIGIAGKGFSMYFIVLVLIISCVMASGGFLFSMLKIGEPISWDNLKKKRIYEICGKLKYSEDLVDQTPDLVEMVRKGRIFSSRKIVRVPLGYWEMFYKGLQIIPEEDGSFWYVFSKPPSHPHQDQPQGITVEQV